MVGIESSLVEKFQFFSRANFKVQSAILAAGSLRRFCPGNVLYREGDPACTVAFMVRGCIRVFKTSENGAEITLFHVHDGEFCLINLLSVVLGRPAMATAIVEQATDAVFFPVDRFRSWYDCEPSIRNLVLETMAHRFMEVTLLVEELAFRKMDQRLARRLLDHASTNSNSLPIITMTHDELARELGTAREVISRLLKEFERLGAIGTSRGQIELLDRTALLRFLE